MKDVTKLWISLPAAIVIIGGAAMYVANVNASILANRTMGELLDARSLRMAAKQDKYNEDLHQIKEDIAVIRTKLEVINK